MKQLGEKDDTARRFELASYFSLPFLLSAVTNPGNKRVLEVGSGKGAKSCAFAPFFNEYVGTDLSKNQVSAAERFGSSMQIDNCHFRAVGANDLQQILVREKFDVIILFAVIEHLTITERIDLLGTCWSNLADGGHLYFAEAPNRAAPVDLHSSRLAHFNYLPLDLARLYAEKSRSEIWLRNVRRVSQSTDNADLPFYRHGVHVGFHEFDLAFGSLDVMRNSLIDDNFNPHLLNLYPELWFEEHLENDLEAFRNPRLGFDAVDVPELFGRYWLEGILKKGSQCRRRTVRLARNVAAAARTAGGFPPVALLNRVNHSVELQCPNTGSIQDGEVMIGYLPPRSRGTAEVAGSGGNVIAQFDMDAIAALKPPYREYQTFFSVGPVAASDWPLVIRPTKDAIIEFTSAVITNNTAS